MAEKEKEYKVRILKIEPVTHDVKRFIIEKPLDYAYTPGQATDVSIDKDTWKDEKRPFTFTCLPNENYLEFVIKIYPEHHGVTEQLGKLSPGDTLTIREPFGTIAYKGKGIFIAGGAGITPFIAILRHLNKEGKLKGNALLFSNKTAPDIILEEELKKILGENCYFTLTREKHEGCDFGRIDERYLKQKVKNFKKYFYVCGPPQMVAGIKAYLQKLGAKMDTIVFEE